MNKLSVKQTEIAVEENISLVDFNDGQPLAMEDIDKLVREARLAQAKVAGELVRTALKFIGNIFSSIQKGLRAATTFDELARLSDRELADIGVQRNEIARFALEDTATRAAKADLAVYGYGMKVARPSNDWVDHIAA